MDEARIIVPLVVLKSSRTVKVKSEFNGALGLIDTSTDYKFIFSSFIVGDLICAVFLLRNDGPVLEDSQSFPMKDLALYQAFKDTCLNFFVKPYEKDILEFDRTPMTEDLFYEKINIWSNGAPI